MLPKANRLTKKKDFETVFTKGKGARNSFLAIKALNNNLPESRFGFVVSKKVSGKAMVRNLVKRRLRATVEKMPMMSKSFDVVVVALPGIEKKEFSQYIELMGDVFKKIT
jgi:ribonuclease P protein component